MRTYDSRPSEDQMLKRLKRDRVSGDTRAVVTVHDGIYGGKYRAVETGLFSEGELVRVYYLRRDGRIQSNPWTDLSRYREATVDDLSMLGDPE